MKAMVLLVVLVLASGCARVTGDGGSCGFTSECADPLVCAGGICRPQCRTDRDCAAGESCSPFGQGLGGVCVPPLAALPCAYHSDCPLGSVCLEGSCRAECMTARDCAGGECMDGTCREPLVTTPRDGGVPDGASCTFCGNRCVDLARSPHHCGSCGNACASGETCDDGACIDTAACDREDCCPEGYWFCDGECVVLATDPRHCGGCGNLCATGTCNNRYCRPSNDACEGALEIVLAGDDGVVSGGVSATTQASANDPGSCSGTGDVFYRFALARRSLVWVGARPEDGNVIRVGISRSCGAAPACSAAFACGATEHVQVLDPGTYYLTVDDLENSFALRIEAIAIEGPPPTRLPLGATTITGDTMSASPIAGSCVAGPARTYYWTSCFDFPGGTIEASTCAGASFDTTIELVNGNGLSGGCRGADACGTASQLIEAIAPGPGLHVLRVGGASVTETGTFTLDVDIL